MDNFIEKLNDEQKEEINKLTREERVGLDFLFKTTIALIDRSINDMNFSDLDYVENLNNVNLVEEKVKLQDGTVISYKEARDNIFKSSITDKKKQANVMEGIFLDLLDNYLSEIIDKCDNNYDKCNTINKIIKFSINMSNGTIRKFDKEKDDNHTQEELKIIYLEDRINNFPELGGVSTVKFTSLYSDAVEKNNFIKIINNMEANAKINRMEINDIIEDIKQNEQEYIQQLDSITEDSENVTKSVINNMVEMKDLDLEKVAENNILSLKELNLVMQKYQNISEKIKDSNDITEDFKTKLEQSCREWEENIVKIGAKVIEECYKKEPNNKEKMIETISKVSIATDSLVNKSKINGILGSGYLTNLLEPNSREFYEDNIIEIINKKTELLNNITNEKKDFSNKVKSGIKAILSKGKMNARQREQEKETKRQQNSLTPGESY